MEDVIMIMKKDSCWICKDFGKSILQNNVGVHVDGTLHKVEMLYDKGGEGEQ